ncbi:unnamed protein product [Trichobilharzia szidati]|nr:unnamed protein product [Trichobilharzia szidati]
MDEKGLRSDKVVHRSSGFDSFLQNIRDLEQELNDTFNEFNLKSDLQHGFSSCLEKKSVSFLYHTELLKALEKIGLNYDDYIQTMNELELDKECDQGEKSDIEVDDGTLLNCTEKVPDNNTLEIRTNSRAERLSNILEDSKQLKNTDSESRLMHQKIEDEISRLEKAKWQYYASAVENAKACNEKTSLRWSEIHVPLENEEQPNPPTDGNILSEFQSDEEYMNLRIEELEAEKKCEQERLKRIQQIEEDSLIFNANNRLYSWRSLLDIMQTKFNPSYSPYSYGTRPHSAVQYTNNRNHICKTNLIDRNFGLYFDLSDKNRTQDSHNRSILGVSDNYYQNMGDIIDSQMPTKPNECKYRSSRLSNIKLSVNATDPGVSTGQSVDEDKASRPGTSSAVTLELARGNDIACELLSPDSDGMGDLKAKSVIDDCPTLGISSPELERTNGGVGRSSRLSNIKLSVNATDPGVSTGQSVDEDKASRPGTSSAVTLELARGNDIACELLSPDSDGMGDLKAKSVIDDCPTLGISSPELERTNGGVGRSSRLSNIKLSVNATDPGVSTGQSVDEDKASRPGTSSAVTLELARGNDIACELLSPDSDGMGDLKAKSVIDDCSTLGISSPELERTNGGVGRSSRLSNIKLSVNATDPGVSTGQSVDEDKASRPGTSSAVTLELARGNDIACELLSPDSDGMGDLKAKSVIDDCPTLGISSPELERTNGGVGRSSRLSNIKLSVNATDPGVSTGQSVDEDKASRPGTSSAVTLELARGNDIACELLSPDSDGMGDLKAKSVIDDCSTLGISSPELERTNGGVGRSNDFFQDNDDCSSVTKVNSFVQDIKNQLAVYINQISSSSHPIYDSSKSDASLDLNVINKLSILDFSGVNLTKLTILKLNNNQIKRISDITGHFPNLIMLDVSSNFITSIDFQTLANSKTL